MVRCPQKGHVMKDNQPRRAPQALHTHSLLCAKAPNFDANEPLYASQNKERYSSKGAFPHSPLSSPATSSSASCGTRFTEPHVGQQLSFVSTKTTEMRSTNNHAIRARQLSCIRICITRRVHLFHYFQRSPPPPWV